MSWSTKNGAERGPKRTPLEEGQGGGAQGLQWKRGEDWVARGEQAWEDGDLRTAIDAFQMATTQTPHDGEGWYRLGSVLDRAGRTHEAALALARSAELVPHRIDILREWGDALAALGRYADAIDVYERGLAVEPNTPSLLFHRARALGALGRVSEANRSLPDSIVQELGELREVRAMAAGQVVVARYWCLNEELDAIEPILQDVFERICPTSVADGVCLDHGTVPVRLVTIEDTVVCDADGARALAADRFMELNETISVADAQQQCCRSLGLPSTACLWSELVDVDPEALLQPEVVMQRRAPGPGTSGWRVTGVRPRRELVSMPVYELRARRPGLSRFLSLPVGVELRVHRTEVVELSIVSPDAQFESPERLH